MWSSPKMENQISKIETGGAYMRVWESCIQGYDGVGILKERHRLEDMLIWGDNIKINLIETE